MQPKNRLAAEIGEAFWRFSLALYGRPGVAPALIALQDRAGHDINLILFALWAGLVRGARLDAAALAAAEAAAADLRRDTVEPLRDLRRQLKASPAQDAQALRQKILGLELAAERAVQQRLAESLQTASSGDAERLAAAEANLALYLGADAQSPEAMLVIGELASLARHRL